MPADTNTRFTYRDYVLFPDDGRRHELLGGRHVVTPAPTTLHQTASRWLQHQLFEQIEKTGRGQVFYAPTDVQLSESDVVQLDILVVLDARRAVVTRTRVVGAPDLVVEILSDATRKNDRGPKLELYRASGVGEYWILDADEHVLEQHVLEGGAYRLAGLHAEGLEAATIPDVSVDLVQVWRQLA